MAMKPLYVHFTSPFAKQCHLVLVEGCYGASVCQTGTDGDGNAFAIGYSMGQFNPRFTQLYESKFESISSLHV